jgi:hypothetical protein
MPLDDGFTPPLTIVELLQDLEVIVPTKLCCFQQDEALSTQFPSLYPTSNVSNLHRMGTPLSIPPFAKRQVNITTDMTSTTLLDAEDIDPTSFGHLTNLIPWTLLGMDLRTSLVPLRPTHPPTTPKDGSKR